MDFQSAMETFAEAWVAANAGAAQVCKGLVLIHTVFGNNNFMLTCKEQVRSGIESRRWYTESEINIKFTKNI